LIRARFYELLAPHAGVGDSENDLFLLGLLSAMEAILDMRMEQILKEITILEDIRDALLGVKNKLREVFDLALHYEKGTWEEFESCAWRLRLPEEIVPGLFMQSVDWARGVLAGHDMTGTPAR
jgi:c-di-GMP phosphodiesterase